LDTKLHRTVNGRYGQVTFFANDTGAVGRSLELYGEWAENELGFVRQFIKPGSTVLDVGAYVGTHTLAFAHFVGAEGCVVAFEPLPEIFDVLRENVSANHLSNVRLENVAVADRAGSIEIPAVDVAKVASFGSTSLRGGSVHAHACSEQRATVLTKAAEVPVVAIDGLGLTKCSVIKIDAEGMESVVIKGAADTIRLLAPVIYAECNSVAEGLKSLRKLKELGYEVRLHVVDAFAPNNFFRVKENIFDRAREAALVGIPSQQIDHLDALVIRPCEVLVRVDTADDLVLGLLNKPQYTEEILRQSAAAKDGAAAWLDEIACLRMTQERLEDELTWAKGAIAEERARSEQAVTWAKGAIAEERARSEQTVTWAKGAIAEEQARGEQAVTWAKGAIAEEQARSEQAMTWAKGAIAEERARSEQALQSLAEKTALFEAAMRQAQFARDAADAASRAAAEAERDKALAFAAQAELLARIDAKLSARINEADQLRGQIESIHGSICWRLTWPIRWLHRQATRFRGALSKEQMLKLED
jgi:FkbM family methyltransferase